VPVCIAAADPKVKRHIKATLQWLVRNTDATIVMVGYGAPARAANGLTGTAAGICFSCPEAFAETAFSTANATLRAAVNEVRANVAGNRRARLLLVVPRRLAANRRINANHVHPNAAGHDVIADQVYDALP
jgi:hypothetical protein